MTSKFEDCKQQLAQLEVQSAKIKKAVGQIINTPLGNVKKQTPATSASDLSAAASGNQQDDFMWEADDDIPDEDDLPDWNADDMVDEEDFE